MKALVPVYGRVYKITNVVNGKVYVGQTKKSLERRFVEHKTKTCQSMKRRCDKLYNAILKYEKKSFKIDLLDIASSEDELNFKEQLYIKILNSVDGGYNLTWGGRVTKMSKETIEKIRASSTGRLHREDSKRKLSLAHKGRVKTAEHIQNITKVNRERFFKCNPFLSNYEKIRLSVFQIDPVTYEVVAKFSSGKEAALATGAKAANISRSCLFKVLKTRGYIWLYDNPQFEVNLEKKKNYICPRQAKNVGSFDLTGNFLKRYYSATEAAKDLGIHFSSIYRCLRGEIDSTSGYIFKECIC